MSRITLRTKLVIGIVALLTAVSIAIGVISVVALETFLVGRLDGQLVAATGRSEDAFGPDQGPPGAEPGEPGQPRADDFVVLPGQREGTLAGLVDPAGVVSAAVLGERGTVVPLSSEQSARLVTSDLGELPSTVDLGAGLGNYRVVIRPTSFAGDLIIGLPLKEVDETVLRLALLVLGVGIVGVSIAAAAGAGIVRLALRPLDRVADAASRVAEIPLDRGDVDLAVRVGDVDANPSTEVGKVGAAVNRMLDHVASALTARQASENKVRTFVADASHELRTPLAAIRGYSELTRRSGHELPEDIVHAMARVESETVRMTALVEDLLLLARLDEGNPLARDSVDLAGVIRDSIADARVADSAVADSAVADTAVADTAVADTTGSAPEHDWVFVEASTPILVAGDAPRLHQVVANLLANARQHTPPGTTVTVTPSIEGTDALVQVSDTGPGIDAELLPRIYQRFVRADGSRARPAGNTARSASSSQSASLGPPASTGLGLSIVQGVIEAHGGTVGVRSEPGETVFWFRMPLARPSQVAPSGAALRGAAPA